MDNRKMIYLDDAIDAFKKELTVGESKGNYVTICSAVGYEGAKQILERLPSVQEQKNEKIFKGIVVEYPSISTYPEYEGKPYFSIKYTEDGQDFIGYGTYKPDVLSEYLKEYFMTSTQPERLTDDDFETIRIHLDADKEKLCNQHRWKEADEYQRIIDRFMAFASAQEPKKGRWHVQHDEIFADRHFCSCCGEYANADLYGEEILTAYCPNCGALMTKEVEE